MNTLTNIVKSLPTSEAVNAVIDKDDIPGRFLTYGSLAMLTSLKEPVGVPSFLNTA